jgi:hypothetical protein
MTDDHTLIDRQLIRELLENWVIWRDAGYWKEFATVWTADGQMSATWKQSGAEEFINGCRANWDKGINSMHLLGGTAIELAGDRAIAQTKMAIEIRAPVEGVLVDVVSKGRFYDFLEKRQSRWGLVFRQPIYEKDRMDPVDPSATLKLKPELLNSFPEGYRHLAYMQSGMGFQVKRDMPGIRGAAVVNLYARGAKWLAQQAGHPATM